MLANKKKIMKFFPKIDAHNQKIKHILKKISLKFKEISLNNASHQGEKLKSIIQQINISISKLYKPSKELSLTEKTICFEGNKKIKLLLLIDFKTKFIVRMSIQSFLSNLNQDVMKLLENFYNKDYSLYLRESFANIELMKMLRIKEIKAFGLMNSNYLQETYPFSCEILKNNDDLHICVLNEINLLTNLSENQMKRMVKVEGLIKEDDLFGFFEKKGKEIRGIKMKKSCKSFNLNQLYDKFLMMVMDLALNNAFILASEYLNEKKESLNFDDFRLSVVEVLMGFAKL